MEAEFWQCSHCNEKHEDTMTICWKCGADREGNRAVASTSVAGEKKSSQEVSELYEKAVSLVEKKQQNQTRLLGLFLLSFIAIAVCRQLGSTAGTGIALALTLTSLLAILYMRLTMGAVYRCPQCDSRLTINSVSKGLFNFKVQKLSHCHNCGESLSRVEQA